MILDIRRWLASTFKWTTIRRLKSSEKNTWLDLNPQKLIKLLLISCHASQKSDRLFRTFPSPLLTCGQLYQACQKTLILLSPEPYFVGYSMAPTSWTTDKPNYGAVDSRSIDMSIMHLVPLGRTVSVSVSLPQLINHHLVSYSGNVADTVMRGWSSMTVLFRRAMTAVCTQLQTKGETTSEKVIWVFDSRTSSW